MHSATPLRSGRPASQMSKRHVVAISESLRASTPKLSIATPAAAAPELKEPIAPQSNFLSEMLDEAHVATVPPGIEFPMPERSLPFRGSTILGLGKGGCRVVNGFDRLEQAIARLIERLPESTLEDKFALVSKWIESYHVDVVPRRLGEQLSLLLNSALTSPRPSDTRSRRTGVKQILVTSFALHQLLLVLTRLKPILAPVIDTVAENIFGAIYIDPIAKFPHEILDVNLDRDTLIDQMKCFQQRTYFQECRDNERRLASVRDFMIDRDKVRQRQLNVLRSVITSTGAYSVGLCFRAWRGYVKSVSAEKKKDSELVRLLDERADLRNRVSQLEDKLAASANEIERLTAANAQLSERVRNATDANRYDALEFSQKIANLEQALADATALLQARHETIVGLQRDNETLQRAAETEVASLRTGFLNLKAPRLAREAWIASNGVATVVSETTASAWCYELARHALTENREALVGHLVDVAALAELAACPKPLTTNGATLDMLTLALLALMPAHLAAERAAEWLKSNRLIDKVCGVVQWARDAKIPLGVCAVEQLLLDANPWGLRTLVGQLVSFAMSSEKLSEVYSPPETVLSPVFNAAWQDIAAVRSVAAVQLSAVDYAARSAVGLNRDFVTRLEKPLSPQEQADRALFTITAADLRPDVAEDSVAGVQQVVRLYYPMIRHLFRGYSGIETAGSTGLMTEFAFTRLIKDARVAQAGLDVPFIRGLVGEGLPAKRFVTALVQVAMARFGKTDPAASLVNLLLRMRSLAVVANVEPVLTALDTEETFASITSDVRPDLLKIFRKYCTEGIANRMGVGEFVKLMQDVKALDDASLTNPEIRELFAAVGPSNGTISFDGFMQLNCLVGLSKIRMPWATSTARASRFLHDVLINPLQRKLALQTPCLL